MSCHLLNTQVNAFDAVRIVDALYRPKYFLTLLSDTVQDQRQQSQIESRGQSSEGHLIRQHNNHDVPRNISKHGTTIDTDQNHKVTILNLPEDSDGTPSRVQNTSMRRGSYHDSANPSGGDVDLENRKFISSEFCVPIVPWLNGDATFNKVVYRGLVRRVLGIVMQNPGILEVHDLSNYSQPQM